jgi:hypothetical protein
MSSLRPGRRPLCAGRQPALPARQRARRLLGTNSWALVEHQPPVTVDPVETRVDVSVIPRALTSAIDLRTAVSWVARGDDTQAPKRVSIRGRDSRRPSAVSLIGTGATPDASTGAVQGTRDGRSERRDGKRHGSDRACTRDDPNARESLPKRTVASARHDHDGDLHLRRQVRWRGPTLGRLLVCHQQQYRAVRRTRRALVGRRPIAHQRFPATIWPSTPTDYELGENHARGRRLLMTHGSSPHNCRGSALALPPNLERPTAAVRTIAFVLPPPRVARSRWRRGARRCGGVLTARRCCFPFAGSLIRTPSIRRQASVRIRDRRRGRPPRAPRDRSCLSGSGSTPRGFWTSCIHGFAYISTSARRPPSFAWKSGVAGIDVCIRSPHRSSSCREPPRSQAARQCCTELGNTHSNARAARPGRREHRAVMWREGK